MGSQAGKYWYRKGRAMTALPEGIEERLASKLVARGDCLEFVGFRTPKGYGQLKVRGQAEYAHRLAYALWVGWLEAGMTVDHTCRNTSCCNPAHLRLLTVEDNVRSQFAAYAEEEAVAADSALDVILAGAQGGSGGPGAAWSPWYGDEQPWP